jgi:hypothetical protein
MKNWKCPLCKAKIIKGKEQVYETLCDHVCDPNNDNLPKRVTYICSDENCKTRQHDCFWDDSGDLYGGFKINDSEYIKSNNAPFGSICHIYAVFRDNKLNFFFVCYYNNGVILIAIVN